MSSTMTEEVGLRNQDLEAVDTGAVLQRTRNLDWGSIRSHLDGEGSAVLRGVLTPEESRAIAHLYPDDSRFRSRVVMARHGFGRGEYKYFNYPLPELIQALRMSAYPHLAPIANHWQERMGKDVRFPADHAAFLDRC